MILISDIDLTLKEVSDTWGTKYPYFQDVWHDLENLMELQSISSYFEEYSSYFEEFYANIGH